MKSLPALFFVNIILIPAVFLPGSYFLQLSFNKYRGYQFARILICILFQNFVEFFFTDVGAVKNGNKPVKIMQDKLIDLISEALYKITLGALQAERVIDDMYYFFAQNFSSTPRANKAKSYFAGSFLSSCFITSVSSSAACQSAGLRVSSLKCRATLAT